MKSWQIFYCELKDNGEWWHGKRPIHVIFQEGKAERVLKKLTKNANINQKYVMVEA